MSRVAVPTRPGTESDWLPLGAASRLIGVDRDTLRRWADEGRVEAFATPGGHRRFARPALERLIATRRTGPRGALAGLGATPDRVSAAYRRGYGAPSQGTPDPRATVPAGEHGIFREHGRRLVDALLRHLDAPPGTARADAEQEALAITADLAERLAASGIPLADAIALFVGARRPFLAELGALARRRDLDPTRLTGLYESASALLDRLLLRLVTSHSATAPFPRGAVAISPGRVRTRPVQPRTTR